jgi:hypothetical protein
MKALAKSYNLNCRFFPIRQTALILKVLLAAHFELKVCKLGEADVYEASYYKKTQCTRR